MGDKEYKARHILVESEAEAKDIIASLKKKGASFEKLQKKKLDMVVSFRLNNRCILVSLRAVMLMDIHDMRQQEPQSLLMGNAHVLLDESPWTC